MRLSFLGAARTVTGSQYLLRTDHGRVLVDCGMFQGRRHMREQNRMDFHFNPAKIDHVILTHAHIDHCGLLPRLVANGFRGRITTTEPSADLCEILLLDSAYIQEEDARYDLMKWQQHGRQGPPPEPLYTQEDVPPTLDLLRVAEYDETVQIAPWLRARFADAGHILGAASVELWLGEGADVTKVVFSGDLGQAGQPLLRDPQPVAEADYLIIESTYGNRLHAPTEENRAAFARIVKKTIERRAHLIIPAFAVGRTQDVLYELNKLVESGEVKPVPVYLDSPLAIRATKIVRKHRDCFDAEARAMLAAGDQPTDFPGLRFTPSVEESKAINTTEGPFIVIAASGMCTAGRIRHHLRNHISHKDDTMLLVGFQAAGTTGRYLQDGGKDVKLFKEWYPVKADIVSLSGFSAHADLKGLVDWASQVKGVRGAFVTHGEENACLDFAATLHRRLGMKSYAPEAGYTVELDAKASPDEPTVEMKAIWARPASEAELAL